MALTTTQQNKVVQLLGYGGKTLDSGSVIFNKVLFDRLQNLNADTEALVSSYLDQIAAIETQMNAAPTRLIAGQVADIRINLEELEGLRKERRKIAREISEHLDIPMSTRGGANVSLTV